MQVGAGDHLPAGGATPNFYFADTFTHLVEVQKVQRRTWKQTEVVLTEAYVQEKFTPDCHHVSVRTVSDLLLMLKKVVMVEMTVLEFTLV